MEQQTNLFGALIFWLYIIAALGFTGSVIDAIVRQEQPTVPNNADRHRKVLVFCVLALVSFSTLSFNMLHVLITSYHLWSNERLPGLSIRSTISSSSIWNWSIESTLFQDFGNAIVADEAQFLWAQSALLATFSICLYMASEGLRRNVPRLWAFFALSQILPISFAQNLFYIAVLRTTPTASTVQFPRNRYIRLTAAYCACLVVAPYTAGGAYLMPTILLARLMLALPPLLPTVHDSSSLNPSKAPFDHRSAQQVLATFAVILTVKQGYLVRQSGASASKTMDSLLTHPAVTSLGMDFLVGIISSVAWMVLNTPAENTSEKLEKTS